MNKDFDKILKKITKALNSNIETFPEIFVNEIEVVDNFQPLCDYIVTHDKDFLPNLEKIWDNYVNSKNKLYEACKRILFGGISFTNSLRITYYLNKDTLFLDDLNVKINIVIESLKKSKENIGK